MPENRRPSRRESFSVAQKTRRESIISQRSFANGDSVAAVADVLNPSISDYPADFGEETTPLIANRAKEETWGAELLSTWSLSWPIIGTFLLQMGPGIINVMFLGHLPEKEALGAGTLSTMFLNITGNTVAMGLATAMDTLCSQAYGAGEREKVGVIFQRALLILFVISLPIGVTWYFAEALLLLVGQEAAVAKMAGDFCRVSVFGMWAIFIYMCLQKYLQTQGIVKPSMYVAVFSNIAAIAMNWILMYQLNLGFIGAPIARAICQWMNVIILLGYMKVTGAGSDTWGGWSKEAFSEWGKFLGLALPGLIMCCAEFWAFEIQTLGAGYFGTEYLSAQSITIQIISLSGMTPMGMGVAASIRVGNFLGQGRAADAKKAAICSLVLVLFTTVITSTLAVLLRFYIPMIYTTWDKAIDVAAEVILVVAGFLVFDGLQICASGILRGCGRQTIGAVLNAICYYGFGLPLGYLFGFKYDHKTKGLWEGMFVALVLVCSTMLVIVLNTDWQEQVDIARSRMGLDLPITRDRDEEEEK